MTDTNRMTRPPLSVRLPDVLEDAIRTRAEEEGRSVSALVRDVLAIEFLGGTADQVREYRRRTIGRRAS